MAKIRNVNTRFDGRKQPYKNLSPVEIRRMRAFLKRRAGKRINKVAALERYYNVTKAAAKKIVREMPKPKTRQGTTSK